MSFLDELNEYLESTRSIARTLGGLAQGVGAVGSAREASGAIESASDTARLGADLAREQYRMWSEDLYPLERDRVEAQRRLLPLSEDAVRAGYQTFLDVGEEIKPRYERAVSKAISGVDEQMNLARDASLRELALSGVRADSPAAQATRDRMLFAQGGERARSANEAYDRERSRYIGDAMQYASLGATDARLAGYAPTVSPSTAGYALRGAADAQLGVADIYGRSASAMTQGAMRWLDPATSIAGTLQDLTGAGGAAGAAGAGGGGAGSAAPAAGAPAAATGAEAAGAGAPSVPGAGTLAEAAMGGRVVGPAGQMIASAPAGTTGPAFDAAQSAIALDPAPAAAGGAAAIPGLGTITGTVPAGSPVTGALANEIVTTGGVQSAGAGAAGSGAGASGFGSTFGTTIAPIAIGGLLVGGLLSHGDRAAKERKLRAELLSRIQSAPVTTINGATGRAVDVNGKTLLATDDASLFFDPTTKQFQQLDLVRGRVSPVSFDVSRGPTAGSGDSAGELVRYDPGVSASKPLFATEDAIRKAEQAFGVSNTPTLSQFQARNTQAQGLADAVASRTAVPTAGDSAGIANLSQFDKNVLGQATNMINDPTPRWGGQLSLADALQLAESRERERLERG